MATDKRVKQLERECHLEKTGEPQCETKNDVENAWNEFTKLEQQYKEAVTNCRATAKKLTRSRRTHIKRHTVHLTNPETVGKKV
ncbi:hypothetical protein GCK32_004079 [Trichostrongylus colubriformis]|uniref:Uncharacterized protein n=1 Tax=Trichostrongylus colubriformis TaxID=6319 RepID=A0AAN8EW17_TRICO